MLGRAAVLPDDGVVERGSVSMEGTGGFPLVGQSNGLYAVGTDLAFL